MLFVKILNNYHLKLIFLTIIMKDDLLHQNKLENLWVVHVHRNYYLFDFDCYSEFKSLRFLFS